MSAERRRLAVPWLLAAGIEAALLYIVSLGDLRQSVQPFWAGVFVAFVLYTCAALWTLRKPHGSTRTILICALLFRLTMWHSPASLSDDIYRYVWDGRVQLAGINPYRYAPDAAELEPLRDALHAEINHPQIPTIYPPLAQLFFAMVAAVRESPSAIKLALTALDVGLCLLIAGLLTVRNMDPRRVVLYAWHPLPLVEIAGSGHIDILGIFFVMAALYALFTARSAMAAASLAAAALAKLVPALLLPIFWLHTGPHEPRRLRNLWGLRGRAPLWAFPLCMLVGFAPYAELGGDLFTGLSTYLGHWHFNDFAYSAIRSALAPVDPTAATHARWLCALLLGIALIQTLRQTTDPLRAAYWSLGAYALLSPTLHPWYLLWILPFMPFFPSAAWTLLAGLVFLAYEVLIDYSLSGIWLEKSWVRWAQYTPFYALLALELFVHRHNRIKSA